MKALSSHLFLVFITALFISSCSKDKKKEKNILSVALSSEISTLDPANSYDQVSGTIIYQSYETLFQYEYLKRPYTLEPLLAKEIPRPEEDGLKYTFKIKEGVRFHDDPAFNGKSRTLKSIDFINQIKRLAFLPTKSNGWWLFKDKIVGLDSFRENVGNNLDKMLKENVEGLKVVDEHTFTIKLKKPYPQLLHALAMSFTTPIPEEVIRFYKNDLSRNIIGTGPFYLSEMKGPLLIKLRAFAPYRKEKYPHQGDRYSYERGFLKDARKSIPFINGVDFHVIKEAQTRWLNFLKKKIDYIGLSKDHFHIAIDELGHLSKELREKNVQMQISPTLTYWWLAFNMQDSLLGQNKNLRLAIAHAIDVDKMIELFTNNVAQKANSIYPPGIPGYDPNHKLPYGHHLAKAKEFLKKAGYPKGKGLPVITFDLRGNSTASRQSAEFIKSQLEKIGVKIKVSLNTFPRFLQKAREGKLQFWQGGWGLDYPDAENILQLLYHKNFPPGPNATYFNNKEFNDLFEKVKYLPNESEKFKLMKNAEKIIEDEVPWIMLYYSRHYILYHSFLNNFRHSDLVRNYYKYLRLSNK